MQQFRARAAEEHVTKSTPGERIATMLLTRDCLNAPLYMAQRVFSQINETGRCYQKPTVGASRILVPHSQHADGITYLKIIWVVVKIMVPCLVLSILRHLVFRGPKRGPQL